MDPRFHTSDFQIPSYKPDSETLGSTSFTEQVDDVIGDIGERYLENDPELIGDPTYPEHMSRCALGIKHNGEKVESLRSQVSNSDRRAA